MRAFLAALLASLALGCADRTAILVEVTSRDLAIPSDVDSITLRGVSAFGATFERTYPLSTAWPHSLTVLAPPNEGVGPVRIDVTGNFADRPRVRRVVLTEFTPGATRRVSVELTRDCVDVLCGDGVDCVAGACVGDARDAGVPDAGTSLDAPVELLDAGGPDAGAPDAPVNPLDAGPPDTGPPDAGPPDTGPPDAGPPDAGPPDAGPPDAGPPDAGPPDAGPPATDAGSGGTARLVLNGIDYDQASTDTQEFVEIYNAGPGDADLTGLALVLINGGVMGSPEYARVALSGRLAARSFAVVGVAGQTLPLPTGVPRFDLPSASGIQNGNPDGIVLWDTTRAAVVDSLSYGGAILSATVSAPGAASGVSLVDGTPTTLTDSMTAVRSLCRRPDGTDTHNDVADWMQCGTLSPGASNP